MNTQEMKQEILDQLGLAHFLCNKKSKNCEEYYSIKVDNFELKVKLNKEIIDGFIERTEKHFGKEYKTFDPKTLIRRCGKCGSKIKYRPYMSNPYQSHKCSF